MANVLFVSHTNFTGNSAIHVYKIASELQGRGLSPIIAVPADAESVADVGRPAFPVLTYQDARKGRLRFPNGRGPDLVHAFTPRELVRKIAAEMVRAYECRYVVHLEDNDEAILSADLGGVSIEDLEHLPAPLLDTIIRPSQVHPLRGTRFVECAAGVTVVTDRLLELAPSNVPTAVIRPGFDEAVLSPTRSRDDVRAELGLGPQDFAIVYTGSVHPANFEDMRHFYSALAALRAHGHPVVLVKTGWHAPEASELPQLDGGVRDLGWVPRALVPTLLAAADVLVQPGAPGPFNDYRFPSKLPDFLASGRPVILPRTNIGLSLRDGHEAIILETGTAADIYRAIALVLANPELAARVGEQGRAFALRELRWSSSVDRVEMLYKEVAGRNRRVDPGWALDLDPPVKVVGFVSKTPVPADARVARAHGIYGFCFPVEAGPPQGASDFPFCFRIGRDDDETIESVLAELSNPAYIRILGAPLLVADDSTAAERWRGPVEAEAGGPVHLALVQRSGENSPSKGGFDSLIEMPEAATSTDAVDVTMRKHLAIPIPEHPWFRSVAFTGRRAGRRTYEIWLRKLILQTLCRASSHEPLIFVEPRAAWSDGRPRAAWLKATRAALRDGVRQFNASRRLDIGARRIDDELRLN